MIITIQNRKESTGDKIENGHFLKELTKIFDETKESNSNDNLLEITSDTQKSKSVKKTKKNPVKRVENIICEEVTERKKEVPRVKRIDPEAKRIDESISKAPPACQTTLKVQFIERNLNIQT